MSGIGNPDIYATSYQPKPWPLWVNGVGRLGSLRYHAPREDVSIDCTHQSQMQRKDKANASDFADGWEGHWDSGTVSHHR
eukprot:2507548-Amphidinium_carterae.1